MRWLTHAYIRLEAGSTAGSGEERGETRVWESQRENERIRHLQHPAPEGMADGSFGSV